MTVNVERDIMAELPKEFREPENFLPECIFQYKLYNVIKCGNPYNYRFTGPCSKRCANPKKEITKN